ncbi:alpha-L-rhamnosidase [Blautia hominis]|uniref:alpha-L-rhamnosidase n=1 Tax=Blautia hominis TaxID=2025493 RepID=A0ABQ0BDE8_9FIRM
MLKIVNLTTEYQNNPLGIDTKEPRISWKLISETKDTVQTSYQIIVTEGEKIVWDSNVVNEAQSVAVCYRGEALLPRTQYKVLVKVTDNHGETAQAVGIFETGLLTYENMQASWITHGFEDNLEAPAVLYREFSLKKKLKQARLYASALGIYEFTVNGETGSDMHFAPGWTSYQKTIQYQTYDITEQLKEENTIAFTVGNGWYKGILGFFNQGDHYGTRTALIAEIVLTYEDGTEERVVTDETWLSTTGKVRYSEIYHGEIIDATLTDNEVRPAALYEQSKEVLIAQQDEPVRITERIPGQKKLITPEGDVVIDFGQNLTGVVEFKIKKERGTKIVIRHAETLDKEGNFYTVNLRTARCTDTFICSGEEDLFRPAFTYHGFRYIAVDGLGQEIEASDFTACVMHTDLKKTGDFTCSNEDVNRLMKNIDWGLRDNFLDIPTDCPQRDERLGYTGDTQIFLSTASVIRDVRLFYEKYLRDLRYEQSLGMGIPTTIPNILGPGGCIAIWHDAGTIIPWTLYWNYGDVKYLEESFESMVACVEYSKAMADEKGLIKSGQQLGDWVSMDVPRGPMFNYMDDIWNLDLNEKIGATDPYYIANVYYANSILLTAKAARVLGKAEEAEQYEMLYEEVKKNIQNEYMTPNGRVISDTQTGNIMALHFDIPQKEDRKVCMERLVTNLKQHKNHLTTGFAGTPFLCPVLSENGEHELAGSVFLKTDCPSWLYHVKMGATTMWELWDGVNPDGSFNKFEMNSFNHYSYGSIGNWVYHNLLGITCLEPAYKKSRIAPRMIKGIPMMKGYVETVYGKLSCEITCRSGKYSIDIEIPANTSCIVALPEQEEKTYGSGVYHFEYETESDFEPEAFNMDSKFSELLNHPIGSQLLNEYGKDLLSNGMFMMFAKDRPIVEIMSMLPPEAAPLLNMVVDVCNQAEKENVAERSGFYDTQKVE